MPAGVLCSWQQSITCYLIIMTLAGLVPDYVLKGGLMRSGESDRKDLP